MAVPSPARPSAGRLLAALSVLTVALAPAALAAQGPASTAASETLDAWLARLRQTWEQPAADRGEPVRVEDPSGDHIYSIPGTAPGNAGPDVDLTGGIALRFVVEPWMAEALFSAAPCGIEGGRVRCPEPDGSGTPPPPPPGVGDEVLGVAFRTAGTPPWAVPSGDPETYYQYALVADTDGDPANDFVANDPYTWDFFQGTDRWFTLDAFAGRDPNLIVTDANWILQPSNARVVVEDDLYLFLIDGTVVTPDGGWRGSAFRTADGTYQAEDSAGDVTGADPTEPLLGFPDAVTTFTVGTSEQPEEAPPPTAAPPATGSVDEQPATEAAAAPAPTSTGDDAHGSAWLVLLGGAAIVAGAVVTVRGRRERGGPALNGDAPERATSIEPEFAPGVGPEHVRRELDREIAREDIVPREPSAGISDTDVRDVLDRRPVAPDPAPAGPPSAPRHRPTAPPLTGGLDPDGDTRIRRCTTCGGTQVDDRSRCRNCDAHVPEEPEPVVSEESIGDGGRRITVLDRTGSTTVTDHGPDGGVRRRHRTSADGTTIEEVAEDEGIRRTTRRPDGSRTVELVDPDTREVRLRSDYLPGHPDEDWDHQWEYRTDGTVIDRTRDADGRLRERTTSPRGTSTTRQAGPDSVIDDVISSRDERDRSRPAAESASPPLHVAAAMETIFEDGREQLLEFAHDLEAVLQGQAPAGLLDQENPVQATQPDWREYWRGAVARIAGKAPSQLTPEDHRILAIDAEWQRRDPDYIERLRDHDSVIDDITPIVVLDGDAAPRTDEDEPQADDPGPVAPAP